MTLALIDEEKIHNSLIFLLFLSTKIKYRITLKLIFHKILKKLIENNKISQTEKIRDNLAFLYETNLFSLKTKE